MLRGPSISPPSRPPSHLLSPNLPLFNHTPSNAPMLRQHAGKQMLAKRHILLYHQATPLPILSLLTPPNPITLLFCIQQHLILIHSIIMQTIVIVVLIPKPLPPFPVSIKRRKSKSRAAATPSLCPDLIARRPYIPSATMPRASIALGGWFDIIDYPLSRLLISLPTRCLQNRPRIIPCPSCRFRVLSGRRSIDQPCDKAPIQQVESRQERIGEEGVEGQEKWFVGCERGSVGGERNVDRGVGAAG